MRYFRMLIAMAVMLLIALFVGTPVSAPVLFSSLLVAAVIVTPDVPPPRRIRVARKATSNMLSKLAAICTGARGQVGFT